MITHRRRFRSSDLSRSWMVSDGLETLGVDNVRQIFVYQSIPTNINFFFSFLITAHKFNGWCACAPRTNAHSRVRSAYHADGPSPVITRLSPHSPIVTISIDKYFFCTRPSTFNCVFYSEVDYRSRKTLQRVFLAFKMYSPNCNLNCYIIYS